MFYIKPNNKNTVTINDVNQNFSKVARMVDEEKYVVIFENNCPKYIIAEYDKFVEAVKIDANVVSEVIDRFLTRNIDIFTKLNE